MRFWTCLVLLILACSARPARAEQQQEAGDSQLRLEQSRQIRRLYGIALLTGVLGAIPLIAGFTTGMEEGFDSPLTLSFTAAAWACWFLEPALMLVADAKLADALGRRRSAANIVGWVLFAMTIALPFLGSVFYVIDRDSNLGSGLSVGGAAIFLPMQILTDVLGTRASHYF